MVGGIRETFVVKTNDDRINPAIEEKQGQSIAILTQMADGGSAYYATKSDVPTNILTTILTFNPTKKVQLVRFFMTGTADAKCVLYIDGNPILTARNSVARKDFDISFHGAEIKLNASTQIEIKALHWATGLQEYSASIFIKDRE